MPTQPLKVALYAVWLVLALWIFRALAFTFAPT